MGEVWGMGEAIVFRTGLSYDIAGLRQDQVFRQYILSQFTSMIHIST